MPTNGCTSPLEPTGVRRKCAMRLEASDFRLQTSGFRLQASEWIGPCLILDGHPLPLGELFPVGRTADPGAVARCASAAERHVRLVAHRLIVDVQEAGPKPVADGQRAGYGRGNHTGGQSV